MPASKSPKKKAKSAPIDITPIEKEMATSMPPPLPPFPSSAPLSSTTMYAGFWRRVGALVIDIVLIRIVTSMFAPTLALMGFGLIQGLESIFDLAPEVFYAFLLVYNGALFFVFSLIYFTAMESSEYQATLGKLLLKIKVVDLGRNRLTVGRAAARHFAKLLSTFTLGIGYLMAAFTERKQALHDMIAGTLVVKK